ncbi:BH0509 family protein [Terribacillus saccharophilus]|nr:BH0509 family protein [Terribacillus saccharophilus]
MGKLSKEEREHMVEWLYLMTGISRDYWNKQNDNNLTYEYESQIGFAAQE